MINTDKSPPGVNPAITTGVRYQLESADIADTRALAKELGQAARAKAEPDQFVYFAAFDAYDDSCVAANQWLRERGTARSVTNVFAAITGFSRGAGTAIAFAKRLNDFGLRPTDGLVAVRYARSIKVVATMLFDPVFTGIMLDLRLPGNIMDNVVVAKPRDEFRAALRARSPDRALAYVASCRA